MHWLRNLAHRIASALLGLWLGTSSSAAELAYVTCQNGDGVSVLDLDGAGEIARWQVPGKPAGVAASAGAVFTVAADSKTVRRHDPATGNVLASIVLEGGPIGIAHDPARRRVFVSDWYNARIWVLSDKGLQIETELETGAAPAGIALSADGRFLASADRDADQVSVYDAETLALHARLTVGTRPFGLSFAPDGRLFVGNVGSNDVTVIAASADRIEATFDVGDRPYGIAFAKDRAFVTNQYADSVSVVALDTLQSQGTIDSGEYPEGINATQDGSRILVANWFDNSVTMIDAETLAVLYSFETCDGPRAFGDFISGGN
ncbi:MAG: beta-propeller fold lactonase family protein [Sulfitobacter sp.]